MKKTTLYILILLLTTGCSSIAHSIIEYSVDTTFESIRPNQKNSHISHNHGRWYNPAESGHVCPRLVYKASGDKKCRQLKERFEHDYTKDYYERTVDNIKHCEVNNFRYN